LFCLSDICYWTTRRKHCPYWEVRVYQSMREAAISAALVLLICFGHSLGQGYPIARPTISRLIKF
jgi:hypothetical protein